MTTTESSATKQHILEYLLKHGQATAQELAQALQISPQATRRHLKDLEAESLVEYQVAKVPTGRPTHIYRLSHQGRESFPNHYGEFAVSFLDAMVETIGAEQINAVLQKQWQRKADVYRRQVGKGSLRKRLSKLAKLRQEEGYMAQLHPVKVNSSNSSEQYILAEHNCAIADVAESFPSVCGNELEMFAAILPDCSIERTHWINHGEHSCGYLITKRSGQ